MPGGSRVELNTTCFPSGDHVGPPLFDDCAQPRGLDKLLPVIDVSALRMLLLTVTSWLARQEREMLAYLIEVNRVLRRQLGGRRLRLTDDDRRQLAARAYRLGRQVRRRGVCRALSVRAESSRTGQRTDSAFTSARAYRSHSAAFTTPALRRIYEPDSFRTGARQRSLARSVPRILRTSRLSARVPYCTDTKTCVCHDSPLPLPSAGTCIRTPTTGGGASS